MDEHFSIDIAKYTKSNNILVGFNLYKTLEGRGAIYKKVIGTVIAHSEPETRNGSAYISTFYVVLNTNKAAYRSAVNEAEKEKYVSVIETENINHYELATTKAAVPAWSKPVLQKVSRNR